MFDKSKVCIVVPAYNEENNIGALIKKITKKFNVIVVDDGSLDKTSYEAEKNGAFIIRLDCNQGYDFAIKTGVKYAVKSGFDILVTLDADGQHHPEIIDDFLKEILSGNDLVVGYRERKQRWSERIFCPVFNFFLKIRDPFCGMKAYRCSKINKLLPFSSYDSVGTEIMLKLIMTGCKYNEIRCPISPRKGDSTFGSGVIVNWKIVRAAARGLFHLFFNRFNAN
jgi:glycosyltransferase involved in cell wall biosynthesis